MKIENNQACFERLWRRLERTRRLLGSQHKRFCVRHVLEMWFGYEADDDMIWEVCRRASFLFEDDPFLGWSELPLPALYPRRHRELLRAIVSVRLGISYYRVDLPAIDKAFSAVFPMSTPLNVNKKKLKN